MTHTKYMSLTAEQMAKLTYSIGRSQIKVDVVGEIASVGLTKEIWTAYNGKVTYVIRRTEESGHTEIWHADGDFDLMAGFNYWFAETTRGAEVAPA